MEHAWKNNCSDAFSQGLSVYICCCITNTYSFQGACVGKKMIRRMLQLRQAEPRGTYRDRATGKRITLPSAALANSCHRHWAFIEVPPPLPSSPPLCPCQRKGETGPLMSAPLISVRRLCSSSFLRLPSSSLSTLLGSWQEFWRLCPSTQSRPSASRTQSLASAKLPPPPHFLSPLQLIRAGFFFQSKRSH